MNRNQAIALSIAAANIVLIMLFPPFDIYSIAASRLPVFAGFDSYFHRTPYMVVNTSVLFLELAVVLINAGIAWLLMDNRQSHIVYRRLNLQNGTLVATAVNLVLIVLFPPFQSVFAISKATLPTFEGFHFIFAHQPNHVVVSALLYLEGMLVLVNGALCWLLLGRRKNAVMSQEDAYKLVQAIRQKAI